MSWTKACWWLASTASLLAAAGAQGQPAATITYGEIHKLPMREMAGRLLPPDQAARVTVMELREPGILHGMLVLFHETARPYDTHFCVRISHGVETGGVFAFNRGVSDDLVLPVSKASSGEEYAPTWPEAATPARCAAAKGFIGMTPKYRDLQMRTITRLTETIAAAAGKGPLPFTVECHTRLGGTKTEPCEKEGRAALASLPLDMLAGIGIEDASYDGQILVGPPGHYVRTPVPPGWEPTVTSIDFRPGSAGSLRAWSVSLTMKDGTVAAVHMISGQVFDR